MNNIIKTLLFFLACFIIAKPDLLRAQDNSHKSNMVHAEKSTMQSIDGTYELTKRVMADGTVLRPPQIKALYQLFHGRLNFNLFIKEKGWNYVFGVNHRTLYLYQQSILRMD
jgi:hypothetical protein